MNSWDAWAKEWKNAKRFFDSKGNIKTKSKLKDKWNKEFMEILKYFYAEGQTDTESKIAALTGGKVKTELEFLEEQYDKIPKDYTADEFTMFLLASIIDRMNLLKSEVLTGFSQKEEKQR